MIFVDTSVWIDYLRGVSTVQGDRLHDTLGVEPVAIGDLVLTEILQGFAREADFETARKLVMALTVFNMGGSDIAVQAANHLRKLHELGITTTRTVDAVIATFCIENKLPLLHSHAGFEPYQEHLGLRVVQ